MGRKHQLTVEKIPVPRGSEHPPPPHDLDHILPVHEFTMGLIAPKGAGKTTTIANLLYFYRGYFNTILVFSPTIHSDEKWDWVKRQKLLVENKPLKQWIKDQVSKRNDNKVIQGPPRGSELEGLVNARDKWSAEIPEEHFFDTYDDSTFQNIMEQQMAVIKLLKKHGKMKTLANRILIIFDDLVGSALFAGSRGSYFKGIFPH
jgi:hypothetical protein